MRHIHYRKTTVLAMLLMALWGVQELKGEVYVLSDNGSYNWTTIGEKVFELDGRPADKLTFEASKSFWGLNYFYVDQWVNGVWQNIQSPTLTGSWANYGPYQLSRSATKVKFYTTTGATLIKYVRNVKVTMASYIEPSSATLNDFSKLNNILEKEFDVNFSNVGSLSVTSNSEHFVVAAPIGTFGGSGTYGTQTVKITFSPQSEGLHQGVITISDGTNSAFVHVSGSSEVPPPDNVTVTESTYTSISLSWSAVGNAIGYELLVAQNGNTLRSENVGNVTHYTVEGLNPSNSYLLGVRAVLPTQTSVYSSITANTLDLTPYGLTAYEVTDLGFTISWAELSDADGYYLTIKETKTNTVIIENLPLTTHSYTITNLPTARTYTCYLSAYVGSGITPTTTKEVSLLVGLPLTLGQTTGIGFPWVSFNGAVSTNYDNGFLMENNSEFTVQFDAVPSSCEVDVWAWRSAGVGLAYYPTIKLYESSNGVDWSELSSWGGNTSAAIATTQSNLFTEQLPATTRYLRITTSETNWGVYTEKAYLRSIVVHPIAPTAKPATHITPHGFTANWEPIEGATDYAISVFSEVDGERVPVDGLLHASVGSASNYAVTGLKKGGTYHYTVKALFGVIYSAQSNPISVQTLSSAVTIGGSIGAFETTYQSPSEAQTLTITAENLTTPLNASTQNGFELSLDGITYAKALAISDGENQPLYVRASGQMVGAVKDTIHFVGDVEVKLPLNGLVHKATQTIIWSDNIEELSFNIYSVPLVATALPSNLPVTFTSSDENIAYIDADNNLMVLSTGTVTITAGQEGNEYYEAAPPLAKTSVIRRGTTTGIQENKVTTLLYPNPTQHTLFLKSEKMMHRVTIHNMAGELILQQQLQANSAVLAVSHLPTGHYVVRVEGDQWYTHTVILKE